MTNVDGNSDTCEAVVTVEDLIAPTMSCPEDQTIKLEGGDTTFEVPDYFYLGEATAVDNCTDPIVTFSEDPLPGTLLGVDSHTVTLYATDQFGNRNCCTFELVV